MIAGVDLLVVGGLSVDRFPDGSVRGGGAALHAARGLAASGLRGATLTVAGPEAAAQAGIAELRALGPLRVREAPRSIRFAIDERISPRLVRYDGGAVLEVSRADVAALPSAAVLVAPVAAELAASAVLATCQRKVSVASLQGWLRILVPGEPVRPRALADLEAPLSAALRQMSALVASTEDLGEEGSDRLGAIGELRRWAGPRPILAVTDGESGAHLDIPGVGLVTVPVPLVVRGVSTVGAGDAFAGIFAARLGRGDDPAAAARSAVDGVSRMLAARRAPNRR